MRQVKAPTVITRVRANISMDESTKKASFNQSTVALVLRGILDVATDAFYAREPTSESVQRVR